MHPRPFDAAGGYTVRFRQSVLTFISVRSRPEQQYRGRSLAPSIRDVSAAKVIEERLRSIPGFPAPILTLNCRCRRHCRPIRPGGNGIVAKRNA